MIRSEMFFRQNLSRNFINDYFRKTCMNCLSHDFFGKFLQGYLQKFLQILKYPLGFLQIIFQSFFQIFSSRVPLKISLVIHSQISQRFLKKILQRFHQKFLQKSQHSTKNFPGYFSKGSIRKSYIDLLNNSSGNTFRQSSRDDFQNSFGILLENLLRVLQKFLHRFLQN